MMVRQYVAGLALSLLLGGCGDFVPGVPGLGSPPDKTESLQIAVRAQGTPTSIPDDVTAALNISGSIRSARAMSTSADDVRYSIVLLDTQNPSRTVLVLSSERKGTTTYHTIVFSGRASSGRAPAGERVVPVSGGLEVEADFDVQRTFWSSRVACSSSERRSCFFTRL